MSDTKKTIKMASRTVNSMQIFIQFLCFVNYFPSVWSESFPFADWIPTSILFGAKKGTGEGQKINKRFFVFLSFFDYVILQL